MKFQLPCDGNVNFSVVMIAESHSRYEEIFLKWQFSNARHSNFHFEKFVLLTKSVVPFKEIL